MDRGAAEQPIEARWHCLSAEESLRRQGSSPEGLTSMQAEEALARYGPNRISVSEAFSPLTIFLAQFKSVLVWVLVAASVVSGALGDAEDSAAILAIVLLNALVGFYQEYSAEKSIAALKRMTAPRARVWRDGAATTISATRIAPGDVIEFEAGDLIAADARLLGASLLACAESALTGEAEAVRKQVGALENPDLPVGDRINMVFMGTSVVAGSGRAVVVATGMRTELGRIAALIREAGEDQETPLQQKLDRFGRTLLWATLGIVALLFGLGLLRGEPIVDLFMTSVSLAVAALPESLPAVATAALSLGVMRMSRRRALVRRLASVETLGSTNVICTDKTGTLTLGAMSARTLFLANRSYEMEDDGRRPSGAIRSNGVVVDPERDPPLRRMAEILVGCNNAHLEVTADGCTVVGDPTEGALLRAGLKAGADRRALDQACPQIQEIPFDSDRKLHSVLRRLQDGRVRALAKGAPEALLARCSQILTGDGVVKLTEEEREYLLDRNAASAGEGFRVLACAFRDLEDAPAQTGAEEIERDLVFVGFCGLRDPPRPEVKGAIAKCRSAGIRIVMITGDHPRTAVAIGAELGLGDEGGVLTGAELDSFGDDALAARVVDISVYARVSAAHKLRVVRAWQANGAVVAMTGDGVNDAPAIKGADIGLAMGMTGSEVTKQASDMVIADDNFATIVDAVEEGRGIFENIRNTLQYLLACNASELMLMTICIVGGLPSPLLPIHLLWINLITDGPPALCLAADRADPGAMNRPPRHRSESLTDRSFLETMLFTAVLLSAVSFLLFLYGLETGGLEQGRSYAFTSMVFSQLLLALGARNGTTPIWRRNPLSNPYLLAVVGGSILLQMASHQNASFAHILQAKELSLGEEIRLLAAAASPLVLLELIKSASRAFAPKGPRAGGAERFWMSFGTALVVAAAAAGAWLQWPQGQGSSARFVTGAVERSSLSRMIVGSGAALQPRKMETFAPAPGMARFKGCEIGSKVAEGQLCGSVGRRPYSAAVVRLEASLAKTRAEEARAEARQARAQKALERARAAGVRQKTLLAERTYQSALAASRRIAAAMARQEKALNEAEGDLARAEIRAPMAGIVSGRAAQGAAVERDGPPLLVVEREGPPEIGVAVGLDDIQAVKIGDRAFVDVGGETLAAQVTSVLRTQSRIVVAVRDPERRLAPGVAPTVRIEVEHRDNVLVAPNEAVRYAQEKCRRRGMEGCASRLWVLRDGYASAASVQLGLSDDKRTEIVGGDLKAADVLILGERDRPRP
ncbi:HAD-IC family P-type ATPase [Methylocystis heyeri]|uniref:HAD-IC family P-type ATPase n=1 Tax=Methylocystis heyeri TaxID=391905 RepID=UPI00192A643C|nr:HAD-IC family P-type ATPase [Methylocystis heyeri]